MQVNTDKYVRMSIANTACPPISACVVIRLSHRLHKGCNFFWSLSREKTGGKEGKKEENIAKQSDHVLIYILSE